MEYYLEVFAVIPRAINNYLRCNIPIFISNLSLLSSDNLEHVTALVGAVVSALVQNRTVATSCHDCADKNRQQCELTSF